MSTLQSRSREIKALEDRLRAAQKFQKTAEDAFHKVYQEVKDAEARSAADTEIQLAKRFKQIAQNLFIEATKEVSDAETCFTKVKNEWDDNVISIDIDDEDDGSIPDGDKKPAAVAAPAPAPAIQTHVQQATHSHAKERKNKPKKATKKSPQAVIVRVPVNSYESAAAHAPEGEGISAELISNVHNENRSIRGDTSQSRIDSTSSNKKRANDVSQDGSVDAHVVSSDQKKLRPSVLRRMQGWFDTAPKQLTVVGAGVAEVNGVYKMTDYEEYSKEGMWEGQEVIFKLYRKHADHWLIRAFPKGEDKLGFRFYACLDDNHSDIPAKDGWDVSTVGMNGFGLFPVPKIMY